MLRLLYLSRGRIIKELSIGERGVREHIKKKSYQKKFQLWLISFMGSWTWLSKPLIIRQRVGLAYQRHWSWSFFRNLIDNQVIISFTKRFLTNQRSHTKTTRESNSKKFNQIFFWPVNGSPGRCVVYSRGRWYSIFILLTVSSGESSAELEK